ncbi:MAG: HTTM domain-containing protein [Bacteroidetes bacterium]|nr:HTTM domain-containing protein [Bacteroidota bacterium]
MLIISFHKTFSLDLRALAFMRIAVGLLILLDLGIRLGDLQAFFTDYGAFPLQAMRDYDNNPFHWSIHSWSGEAWWQIILFAAAGIAALALSMGFKIRIATILSWLLMVSLHNRNPMILQSGDDLLRILLFWGIFLPWDKRYSFDSRKDDISTQDNSYFGLAGVGYILLFFSLYFFSGIQKSSAEWLSDGTAIYYALSIDQMVLPLGKMIYHYPTFLKILTHLVWGIEVLIPFLLISPYKTKQLRLVAIIIFCITQICFGFTLYVGLFFLISIVASIGLIPFDFTQHTTPEIIIESPKPTLLENTKSYFLTIAIAFSFLWNIADLNYSPVEMVEEVKYPAYALRLEQNWRMFAPAVYKNDGWFIFAAVTQKGDTIDLNRNGAPINYQKPENIVSMFPSDRWRKFSENLTFDWNKQVRPFYCKYILDKWYEDKSKTSKPEKIISLSIIYMEEFTLPDYKPVTPVKKVLWTRKNLYR